jgi:hypothetical protein
MAKKRERTYTHYLEARGDVAYSNEVLGKNIGEENEMRDVPCKDSRGRDTKCNLRRCPSGLVLMLWNSRHSLSKLDHKFSIGIFIQEGRGQIRDKTDWYRKRHATKKEASYAKF